MRPVSGSRQSFFDSAQISLALIGGTCAVMAIYLAANVAYLAVLSIEEMRTSKLVAADVAQRLVGGWGVVLVSLTVGLEGE